MAGLDKSDIPQNSSLQTVDGQSHGDTVMKTRGTKPLPADVAPTTRRPADGATLKASSWQDSNSVANNLLNKPSTHNYASRDASGSPSRRYDELYEKVIRDTELVLKGVAGMHPASYNVDRSIYSDK